MEGIGVFIALALGIEATRLIFGAISDWRYNKRKARYIKSVEEMNRKDRERGTREVFDPQNYKLRDQHLVNGEWEWV